MERYTSRGSRRLLRRPQLTVETLEHRLVPCVDPLASGVELHHHDGLAHGTPVVLGTEQGHDLVHDLDHHDHDAESEFHAGDTGGTTSGGGAVALGDNPALVVPAYSSLPGAPATLFLDFNGFFEAQWGSYSNIDTPAYDTDANPAAFSATELANIEKIWRYVAEDYAPFNVNVTTVEPGSFANGVALRVAIGGAGAWSGGTYGGVSYINSFTNSISNTAYVFSANLGGGAARYVADASSHESGHAFGLLHQSTWSGTTKTAEYQSGPGDGTAPVMGNSYSATRSLWWYGTSTSATTYQNDLALLAGTTNGFGYRLDDHGNASATASPLAADAAGNVSGSGLIGQMTDLDVFAFTTGAGTVNLTVNVPQPYNNLDARLELRDASGAVVASAAPSTSFGATLSYAATAGTYYLTVASHGVSANATATNYGFNVGQYTLTGTVIPNGGATAPAAPSSLTAAASSSSQINLAWADHAANEDGFKVERFDGVSWSLRATLGANATSWQDTGLTANTTYTYRVRAFNVAGDSAASNTASATTLTGATAPAAPSGLTGSYKTKPSKRVVLTWVDNAANETGFYVDRSADGGATWTRIAQPGANATTYTDTTVATGVTYAYRVAAFNAAGVSGFSNVATVTTGRTGNGKGLALGDTPDGNSWEAALQSLASLGAVDTGHPAPAGSFSTGSPSVTRQDASSSEGENDTPSTPGGVRITCAAPAGSVVRVTATPSVQGWEDAVGSWDATFGG